MENSAGRNRTNPFQHSLAVVLDFCSPVWKAAVGRVFAVGFVAFLKDVWSSMQGSPSRKLFVPEQGHGRSAAAPLPAQESVS